MKKEFISLENAQYVGAGQERQVYIHPSDPDKIIKVVHEGHVRAQTDRETRYFKRLIKRLPDTKEAWAHLPRFYGLCMTDKGEGSIVEAIRDFDGNVSKTLEDCMVENGIEHYRKELDEIKEYFLKYLVIFNHDLSAHNIVVQRISENERKLVLIDAIGDVVAIPILNIFPSSVRKKINRRWGKFEKKMVRVVEKLKSKKS